MARNFLPFAKRSVVAVPVGGRASTPISDMSHGGCIRAHLGDISIAYDVAQTVDAGAFDAALICRIGILGRGYFTEGFYAHRMFKDGIYPESGVWHFPKPYRMQPGQRLRALTRVPAAFSLATYPFIPGIMFNGVRLADNEPIMLYDRALAAAVAGGAYNLNRETLQCPADSAIDLYSVVASPDYDRYDKYIDNLITTQTMIWGPDDRPWWDQQLWSELINPPVNLINLTRPEWVLSPSESVTLEFWNNHTVAANVHVTLRGSLEVEV